MNTKTKSVGRPAAQLVYPEGTFTIKQLHSLNKRKVRWELSIRQHIERNIAKRWISKDKAKVHTGNVGKPADLFRLTKWGAAKLTVKASKPEATVTEIAVEAPIPTPAVEIPLTASVPTPVVETPAPAPAVVIEPAVATVATAN